MIVDSRGPHSTHYSLPSLPFTLETQIDVTFASNLKFIFRETLDLLILNRTLVQGSVQHRLSVCLSVCLFDVTLSHWSPRIFNKYSNSWECAKGSTFEKRGKDPLIIPASNEQGGEPKSPDYELASSLGSLGD